MHLSGCDWHGTSFTGRQKVILPHHFPGNFLLQKLFSEQDKALDVSLLDVGTSLCDECGRDLVLKFLE